MHTTQELWQVSLYDPILTSFMRGVFPSDKLPVVNNYPSALIANTDSRDQPGTHWIAMYFVTSDESEFFDSYGFPPETYDMDGYIVRENTCYNDKPLQGLNSDVCGDYCLFYLLHRARNVDLNTIQAKFKRYDTQWNDAQVAHFVHSYVNSITKNSNVTLLESKQQVCKSFQCWRKQSINYF